MKQSLADAMNFSELRDKHEMLKMEFSEALESSEGTNGSLLKESTVDDNLKYDDNLKI